MLGDLSKVLDDVKSMYIVIGVMFFFLYFTGALASYVMQPTELPFIGSDPLYNGVLHVAMHREEVGVVKC
jgi:hypothetical protein